MNKFPKTVYVRMEPANGRDSAFMLVDKSPYGLADDDERVVGIYTLTKTIRVKRVVEIRPGQPEAGG